MSKVEPVNSLVPQTIFYFAFNLLVMLTFDFKFSHTHIHTMFNFSLTLTPNTGVDELKIWGLTPELLQLIVNFGLLLHN